MSNSPDNTLISQPRIKPISKSKNKNPFLGCFGFSIKKAEKKKEKVNSRDPVKDRWKFYWFGLRRKKVELYEKVSLCKRVHADEKMGRKSQSPVIREVKGPVQIEGQGRKLQDKPEKEKHKAAQDVMLEHSKRSDGRNQAKTGTRQVRFCVDKKLEAKKDQVNLPQSMELGHESNKNLNPQFQPSSSLTLQKMKKTVSKEDEKVRVNKGNHGIMCESIHGLSIIMVTLLIMLVWGKLCAIICTSVCLYLIPWIKRARGSDGRDNSVKNGSTNENLNMNHERNKKKVVFEGFLERNRRSTLRILDSTNKNVG